jgi:hypothetical protein
LVISIKYTSVQTFTAEIIEPVARRLYRFFDGVHDDLIGAFLHWYDVFSAMEADGTAREWLDLARALDPTNPEVLARSGGPPHQ